MTGATRLRQAVAVARVELRRILFSRRSPALYLVALLPGLLLGARALALAIQGEQRAPDIAGATTAWAVIYQTFVMRFVIFFGCVGVFGNLIRGDVVDKTLHYFFLVPVRRDVLLAGRYVAGLIATTLVFCGSVLACLFLLYLPDGRGPALEYFTNGPGLAQAGGYLGVTILACVGYGGLFAVLGIFLRNPSIAAVGVLGWESINFLLPAFLKRFSVVYYLQSLCPVPVAEGPLAVIAAPASPWVAIPGLLVVTAALLAVGSWKIRRMEIAYTSD